MRRRHRKTPDMGAGALILLLVVLLAGCGTGLWTDRPDSAPASGRIEGAVTVLAAASLTESFEVLADRFERTHPGTTVRLTFGASSTLAQQAASGAPADVFASADTALMRQVRTTERPAIFARNRLQIAVPKENPAKVRGLADFARSDLRIALCAVEVPCGSAAKEALTIANVDAQPDTYGNDVKKILTLVRLGEVDVGMVYRTDVEAAKGDVEGIDFPEAMKVVNDYPIAVLEDAPNPVAAKAFAAYVRSPEGQRVLHDAGFEIP